MKKVLILLCVVLGTQLSFGQKVTKKGETTVKKDVSKKDTKTSPKKVKLTAEQRGEKQTSKLDDLVKLTNDQNRKVYLVYFESISKCDKIRGNKGLAEDKKKEQLNAEWKKRKEKLFVILTPQQEKIYNEDKTINKAEN